ncbi:MAG: hypothetical protein NC328_02840 [Muribaculum sp.]|nr:hypothetical protein [Muribaculum sp.]
MKLIFSLIAVLVCFGSVSYAANSLSPSSQVSTVNTQGFSLSDKGIGDIILGMKVSDIPQSVSGLYERVEKVETPDAEEYQFFMGENAIFAAGDYGDGIVSYISLFNESPITIATSSGSDYIEL